MEKKEERFNLEVINKKLLDQFRSNVFLKTGQAQQNNFLITSSRPSTNELRVTLTPCLPAGRHLRFLELERSGAPLPKGRGECKSLPSRSLEGLPAGQAGVRDYKIVNDFTQTVHDLLFKFIYNILLKEKEEFIIYLE